MTGPSPEDVRAAFPNWDLVLTGDGYWSATLTTSARPRPVITAATLAGLAEKLNAFISGGNGGRTDQ